MNKTASRQAPLSAPEHYVGPVQWRHMVEWMRAALESHRVPASHMSLEMRMLDAAEALPEYAAFAMAMKELGVGLTLSGLEAGAQGTAMLLNLPVDYVKLAPRYTSDADENLRSELREADIVARLADRASVPPTPAAVSPDAGAGPSR